MPNLVAPPLTGITFGAGVNGPVRILMGTGDPNQSATDNNNHDISTSDVGSLFLRNDVVSNTSQLYVKTSYSATNPGSWTSK